MLYRIRLIKIHGNSKREGRKHEKIQTLPDQRARKAGKKFNHSDLMSDIDYDTRNVIALSIVFVSGEEPAK